MTLDQLEMIEAIVTEGSYQAAARKIHKSQPALSTGIKKVEELYQIQIFSREGYRPVLTEVGKRFYQSAQATLSTYRDLHKLASELSAGIEPILTIALDPIVTAQRIEPLLNIFSQQQYHSVLQIKSGVLFDNAQDLIEEKADLAIGHYPQIDNEAIEHFKFCHVELIPVVHKKMIGKKKMSKGLFQFLPNIVVKTKLEDDSNLSASSKYQWYVDSHPRKCEFILLGVGWGRISRAQAESCDNLIVIPEEMVSKVKIDIHVMRNRYVPHGPLAREIWELMKTKTSSPTQDR